MAVSSDSQARINQLATGRFLHTSGPATLSDVQAALGISENSAPADLAAVQAALDVPTHTELAKKLRKVHAKLYNSRSTVTHLRVVHLGDSLAAAKFGQFKSLLDRMMGGFSVSDTNAANSAQGAGTGSAGNDLDISSQTNVITETGKYSYWPTGVVHRIAPSGSARWVIGGVNPTFTTVMVPYFREPNAGTINLVVGGTIVATANAASATLGIDFLTYTQAAGQATVDTTVTGADVRVSPMVHVTNAGQSGLDVYGQMSTGGLLLESATSTPTGRANWQTMIAQIAPDLITFEMDDDFGDAGSNDTAWEYLTGIIDAAAPTADRLIFGSTPRANNDNLKVRARNYLRSQCAARGAAYVFFDSYAIMNSYSDMIAIFGADDGTHPQASAQGFAAQIALAHLLGIDPGVAAYTARAVNDLSRPSILAKLSQFGGTPGRGKLQVYTDNSFEIDWQLRTSRALSINDLAGNPTGWFFSANTGVFKNRAPSEIRINSDTGVARFVGAGSPEGTVTAPPGSTFQRSDGGAGTCFYVKESGNGSTGWVSK